MADLLPQPTPRQKRRGREGSGEASRTAIAPSASPWEFCARLWPPRWRRPVLLGGHRGQGGW